MSRIAPVSVRACATSRMHQHFSFLSGRWILPSSVRSGLFRPGTASGRPSGGAAPSTFRSSVVYRSVDRGTVSRTRHTRGPWWMDDSPSPLPVLHSPLRGSVAVGSRLRVYGSRLAIPLAPIGRLLCVPRVATLGDVIGQSARLGLRISAALGSVILSVAPCLMHLRERTPVRSYGACARRNSVSGGVPTRKSGDQGAGDALDAILPGRALQYVRAGNRKPGAKTSRSRLPQVCVV